MKDARTFGLVCPNYSIDDDIFPQRLTGGMVVNDNNTVPEFKQTGNEVLADESTPTCDQQRLFDWSSISLSPMFLRRLPITDRFGRHICSNPFAL